MRALRAASLGALAGVWLWGGTAGAVEVQFFLLHEREDFLEGTLEGIAIDPLGTLHLADRVERLADIEEPFLFAAADHPEGWVVGTGNNGRVLRVDRAGEVRLLFAASEPQIFALWVDPDGTVYAGSSPGGKVYRISPDGEAQTFFDPGETYIWALERDAGGRLLVATGTEGRLYAVDGNGRGEVLYEAEDTHLRSLQALENDSVLVGTAGQGLVLEIDPSGAARTLHDAAQPEVVAFASAPGGVHYVAVLQSEASLVEGTPLPLGGGEQRRRGEEGDEGAPEEEPVRVIVEAEPSIPRAAAGPRSEILRITPDGRVESVWVFGDETVYALAWARERLWVGTGLDGGLYSLEGDRMVLEKDVEERQVVALLGDEPGPAFATTNAAALYRMVGDTERQGTYTSPVLDAGGVAQFGTLHWHGHLPEGARLAFSFRRGMSGEPDATWSEWTRPAAGREVALAGGTAARFLQWRAHFEAEGGRSPEVGRVSMSYRQVNVPPRIVSLSVLDAGQILVPPTFNPGTQVYEPAHPTRDRIFTVLRPSAERDQRLKQLWKHGYRTLRWEAQDANQDELTFDLSFRRDEDSEWLPMAEEIEDLYYSFDATVLPDGLYRFRLRASDSRGNGDASGLVTERVSEAVVVDHTPPQIASVSRQAPTLRVEVADRWSPIREALVSLDAGPWLPARAADGLVDGHREVLLVELPPEVDLVLLRLTDAALNVASFDLLEGSP